MQGFAKQISLMVALRKESVDRNTACRICRQHVIGVALRKESVDRNGVHVILSAIRRESLSARRAWIEISCQSPSLQGIHVALRKESVDRNMGVGTTRARCGVVALRKESVDRNHSHAGELFDFLNVALRKESVDRNRALSWLMTRTLVALRKESVDRNGEVVIPAPPVMMSLSARRAWIEISSK